MPAQTEHHVGGTKHFECRVGGFPRPQIRWYKDGREITDSSRYQFDHSNDGVISMVIQNITHEDEGHYRCRAENSEGLASTSAYLLVKAHKELPDEPITSVHSMQFEETIVYTEKYKKAREIRKKIEALDNENSYEENYVIRSKEKRQREEEEEELTWKSLEAVISAQRTSSQLISPSPSSGTQRKEKSDSSETQRKEEAEEEESKISKDMLEKCYHSSDDDQDSVRLMTISERSEPISLQESLKDFEEEEEKSLLMRQTARLFSHELDEDEDFFKRDSAYQAVLTEMVGEHVMQELLQQEEQASKIAEWQVKSEIERVTKTEVQNSASKTDENGLLTAVKDLTKLVVSEERVVKLEAETKLASGDENNSLLPTPKQIENVDIERKRALADKPESLKKLKKDEADTVKSATSENVKLETAENVKLETVENVKSTTSEHVKRETAENVKSTPENVKLEIPENVKSVTPENVTSATLENGKLAASENVEKNVRDDVFQEEENQTHSVLTQKLIEVTEGKLSYDDVDLQVAGVEISDDSKVDSTDLPNEPIQQIIERETDFKLEDDDEETVSDSETEGSVGSVVGVNVTPASSLQKKEIEESNIDSDKTVFSQNLNETELSQTRFGEEKQKAIEDYPIIQPADDGSEVDGSTVEVVEPSTSWVQKVAQDKPQPEKTEDATAIGGDKEPVAKPVIKQVMEDIKIEAGKTLRLRTQVQAVPRAEVTWSKEGEVIIAGKRITVVTEDDVYTLEIENVGEEDAGRYRMTAINSAGSVYSEVLVSIVGQRQLSPALSPSLPVGHPRFVMRPQNVTVAEFESIKLSCSVQGDPMPKVSWEKDGERLRTSKRLRLYETRGIFYLEIPEADAEDAGEYVCTAVNSEGTVTASVTVSMQDMENVVQISCDPEGTVELTEGATGGAVESSSDEMFLKPFLVLMDYTDPDSKSGLRVGEFVEVLDSKQKSGMWLVRGMVDKEKVLFAPSYLLCASGRNGVFEEKKKEEDTDEELATVKRRDKKLTHSPKYGSIDGDNDTSEDEFRLRGVYPDYVAVADYNPSDGEKNSIRLSEGQIVEIIDKERSDLWLVQTRPTKTCPSRQGWVPSAYLEEKSVSAQFMRRSRETFREEVLQVKNKQQEAGLKRRYVLKELEETEREYIRDLKTLIDNYVQPVASMTENLPDLLQAGADLIFSNISTIYKFHEGPFLQDLIGCCANPSSIGPTFLRWESEFYNYIKYWSDREAAGFILESVDIKSFFKELSKKQAVPGEAIFSLLNRPIERLKMYQLLLKDILRFSARAGDDCSQVEAAIAMLISIEKEVGNAKLIPLLEGCDFELTELGHLIRHDDLCVWEGDVSSTRVKDRHVFLFSEKIAMTKKKKPENSSDKAGFTYRTSMDLANVRLKENVPEDDRRFELWFIGDASVEKVTFQARSMFSKLAWVKDIRDALTKIGVIHPDHQSSEKDDEGKATPKASPQASPPRQQTSEAVPMKDQTSGKQKEQAGVTNGAKLTNSDLDLNDSDDVSSYYTAPEPDSGSEHVRPSLGHKQHRVICTEGSHTQLDCFVGKVSTSEVSWTKDRQPIQEGNGLSIKHQGDISSLVFSKAKASNSGKYTVTVVTSKGKHSTNFDLAVVDEFIETDTSTHKSEDGTDSESDTATEETQAGVDRSNRGGEKGLIVISQYEDHQTTVETAFTSQQFIESFVGEVSITAEEKEKELKAKEEEERLQQLKAKEEEERLQQLKAKEEEERLQQLKAKEEEERLQQLKAKEEEERLQQLKAKEEEERLQQLKAKEEEERLQQLKAKEEEERLQQLKAKEEEERLQQLKAKEEEERLQQLKAKEEEERLQQLKAKEEEERLQQLKAKEEEERLQQLKAKEEEERLQQLKAKEEEERLQQLKAKEEEERLQQLKAKEEEERLQQLKAKEEEERLQQLKAKEAEERLQQLKAKEEEERLQQLKAKEEEERLQQLKAKEEEERLQQLKAKEEEERLQQLKAKEEEERLQQLKAKEEEERLQQLKAKEEEERLQQLIAKEEEERLQQLKAKEEEERLQQLKAKEEEERLQQLKAKEEEQRLQQLKAKEEEERLQQLKAKEEEERLQQLKAKEEEERLQQLIAKEEEERLQQLKAKEEEERLQQLKAKEEEERLQQLKAKEEEERLQQLKAKEEEERLQQLKAKEEEERLQQLIAKEEEERLQQLKAKEEEERLQQLKAKEEEERLQQLKAKEEEERLQQLKAKEEEERLQQLKAKEEEERLHELKVKEEELQKLRAREEEILKEERLKAEKEDLLLHFETSLNETALEPLSDNTSSQSKLEFDSSLGDSNLFSHPSLTSLDSTLSSSLHIEEKSVQDFETSLEESQTGSYFKLTSAESSWSTHEHSGENIVLEFNSTVEQSKSSSHFEVTSTESSSETFENAEKPVLESDSTVEQSRTTSHIEVTLTESSFEKPVLEFDTTVDQSRSSHFEITSTESSFEKPVLESDSTVEQSRTSSQLEVTSTESSFERPVVEFDTTVKQSRTTSHIEVTSTESSFEKPVLEFDTTVDQSRSSHFEITSTESSFEKPVLEFDSAVEQSRTASHIEVTSTESSFEKPVLEFDTTVDQSRSSHFEITSTESSFDKPVLEFDSAVEQSRTASHIEVTSTESSFEKPVLEFDTTVDQSRSSHFENTSTESSFEKPVFESDSAVEQSRTTSHIEVTSTENSFEKPVLEFDSAVEQSKTSSKFEVTSIQSSSETSGNSVEQPVLKFDSTVEQSKSVSGLEVTSTESNSETSENSVEQPVLQSDSTVEQNRTTLQFEVTSIESSSENTSEKPVLEFDSNLYQSKTPLQFEVTSTESTSDTSVEQPVLEFESSVQEQHSTEESDSFRLDSSNNSSEVITFDLASSKQQLNKFDSDISVSASQQQRLSDLSPETPQQQRDLALEKPNQVEGTTQSSLAVEGRQATSQGKPFCAPQVTSKMDDCVIELGEMARFDCRVSAYPDPEITWFKDGNKVIPSAKFELVSFHDDIFSLLIKKVDTEDSGRYTCMAKNEYGEAKSEALLNVLDQKEKITDAHVAPCFLTKFYDIEAMEGVPVEFVCVIYGNPEPTVTWLLNGKEVEISSEILTRRQEDSVMMAFRSVQVCHSGEIICKLKNDSGEAMCKARLKVKEDISKRGNRPLFLEQPSDKEVSEGEEVTFECTISGLPDPDVTWYFNGRELYESRRRTMKRKGGQKYILTLREVVPENAGVYTCKAVNRAGDASCAVELSVKELPTEQTYRGVGLEADTSKFSFPPAFTRRIQDTMTAPGRMVRFEAMVIGVPEPEIEWVKDGFPLKAGSKYKMGREGHTSILVVENCDSIDDGTYTCNVYNDAGKASCSAQLRVQEERMRPSVPRFYSPSVARESYTESPTPSRRLVAREIPLEEKIPSMPIDKPICLDIKPNSVKLSWMPAPIGSLPENAQRITYTIEARELPNSSWVRLEGNIETTNHYIHNLKPDKEYMFRVRADNRYGTSETTLPCTLKAREEPARRESVMRETETPVRPVLPKTRPYISDIGKETIQLGWKPAELPYTGRSMSMPPVSYRVEAQKLPSEEWVPLASRVRKPSLYLSDLEPDRDYNIRVRAQTPYGVSQPTEPLWIPRAKAFTGVPVTRPTISEIEEGTARLQWNRVDIPAFDNMEQPLLYMIEMQEPPSYRWRELARRVPTNSYIVRDLEPAQDYRFRVRAESLDGLLSEPSPATSVFRTLALTHTPVDRLQVEEYDGDLNSARLSWRRVEVPPYGNSDSPLLYMIEYETPQMEGWRPLASGIPTTRYHVPDISPTDDYRFRVRALSPYGVSPPSYPTGLYRQM
ncbi:myosin light chain kinase smooth muscle, partial [Biomphalaria pfeifferi]